MNAICLSNPLSGLRLPKLPKGASINPPKLPTLKSIPLPRAPLHLTKAISFPWANHEQQPQSKPFRYPDEPGPEEDEGFSRPVFFKRAPAQFMPEADVMQPVLGKEKVRSALEQASYYTNEQAMKKFGLTP